MYYLTVSMCQMSRHRIDQAGSLFRVSQSQNQAGLLKEALGENVLLGSFKLLEEFSLGWLSG